MAVKGYKIRYSAESTLYSQGIIKRSYDNTYRVDWASKKGKVWTTETAVKEHLLKYTKLVSKPDNWVIVQIDETDTKPIDDWFDSTMVFKLLKR